MAARKSGTRRTGQPAPEAVEQEPAAGQPAYAELLQRVQELTNRMNQQQRPNSKLMRRPALFMGTAENIANRDVETWLRMTEDYLAVAGEEIDSPDGVKTVASYLGTDPRGRYDSQVQTSGEFEGYEGPNGFKRWIIRLYSPADPLHTYRDAFEKCRQKPDESFDAFHARFVKAHSMLDHPYEPSQLTYTFIAHLVPHIIGNVRRDIVSYDNLTTDDILAKLKRMYPSGLPPAKFLRKGVQEHSSSLAERISNGNRGRAQDNEPTQKRHKSKHTYESKRGVAASTTPLNPKEKSWLTYNVKNGGGKYIYEHVQKNPEWRQIADKIKACYQCGAIGHGRENCPVKPTQQPERLNHISSLQSISSLFEPGALDHLNSKM
jgi:hypothetical protein